MRQRISTGLRRVRSIHAGTRVRIFRGALRQVESPATFFVRECLFYPMRPVVVMIARRHGGDIGAAWTKLMRGSRNAFTYRLRADGRKIVIRHGTVDVAVIWEIFDERTYAIPVAPRHALEGLGRPIRLVDLGANIGLGARFLDGDLRVAEVIAYEPVTANLAILERNRAADPSGRRWHIIDAAAFTRDAEVAFATRSATDGRISDDGGAQTVRVPARDVFRDLARADLLKMDIEGGEWAILQDPRFGETPLQAVVMEFHTWGCPEPDPEGCARRLFQGAGFTVGPVTHAGPGVGMLWAWRG